MLLIFFINNKNSITEKMPVRILIIKSNSMYPILKIKDIIIIKKSNTYNVNDIITYNTENEVLITHRIVKSCEGGFITKGDNNNSEDNDISYTLNGGSITGENKTYTVETDSFTLPTPTKNGYTFTGWTGTGLSGATKTVTVSKGSTGYGYRVNIQVSCSDSGSGINRVLTYYDLNGGWTGETNITGSMTDSFWFKPGYRKIRIVVFDNAGNSSETTIAVQCG